MLIDFNDIKEMRISGMNHGTGEVSAKMYMDHEGKIIFSRIHAGGSIGTQHYQYRKRRFNHAHGCCRAVK